MGFSSMMPQTFARAITSNIGKVDYYSLPVNGVQRVAHGIYRQLSG